MGRLHRAFPLTGLNSFIFDIHFFLKSHCGVVLSVTGKSLIRHWTDWLPRGTFGVPRLYMNYVVGGHFQYPY